jgi:arylformamidase
VSAEPGTPQFEYVDGQLRDSHAALFARFAAESAAAVAQCAPELDIPYGKHPRQTYDMFRAQGTSRGILAYFHGGYWQSRDKADFRFVAPGLVADGFDVALFNYPLCPHVSVADIVESCALAGQVLTWSALDKKIVLAGHSAGAQIAVELGMQARGREWSVAGVIALSGLYDLAPLIETTLNAKLGLDAASAGAASPLYHVRPYSPPTLFAVGQMETDAFRQQTRQMNDAWYAKGNRGMQMEVTGADHFSILDELSIRGGRLSDPLRELLPSAYWDSQ